MSGSEKKQNTKSEQERIRATRKFLEVSRCSRAKQRERNVQKEVYYTCKVVFWLIKLKFFAVFVAVAA